MNELEKLRPEVRKAIKNFDDLLGGFGDPREFRWQTIRAELLRLATVESELAALKARIADAPRVYHSSFEYTLDASTLYARAVGIPGEETYALVKVED